MELQRKIRNMLGRTWTENALETCVLNLSSSDKLIGHKEADFCDPRYTALLNYAREYLPDNPEIKVHTRTCVYMRAVKRNISPYRRDTGEIKFEIVLQLSQDITRILRSAMKRPRGKDIYPEQSALAATIFQVKKSSCIFAREECVKRNRFNIIYRDDSISVVRNEEHGTQPNDIFHGANSGSDRLDYLDADRERACRASDIKMHSELHRRDQG